MLSHCGPYSAESKMPMEAWNSRRSRVSGVEWWEKGWRVEGRREKGEKRKGKEREGKGRKGKDEKERRRMEREGSVVTM